MSDDITGASGAIPRNDFKRLDEHAERYYEEIRKRKSDVAAIAGNTGFSIEDVQAVKNHLFFDEHELVDGVRRFDPLYDIAVSWQRLIEGKNIQEMDLILLNHEFIESKLMKQGKSYSEAHDIAEKQYDYAKFIKELNAKGGIF